MSWYQVQVQKHIDFWHFILLPTTFILFVCVLLVRLVECNHHWVQKVLIISAFPYEKEKKSWRSSFCLFSSLTTFTCCVLLPSNLLHFESRRIYAYECNNICQSCNNQIIIVLCVLPLLQSWTLKVKSNEKLSCVPKDRETNIFLIFYGEINWEKAMGLTLGTHHNNNHHHHHSDSNLSSTSSASRVIKSFGKRNKKS